MSERARIRGDDFDRVEIMGRLRAVERGERTMYERALQDRVTQLEAARAAGRENVTERVEALAVAWERTASEAIERDGISSGLSHELAAEELRVALDEAGDGG